MVVFVDGCTHYASDDVLTKWAEATSATIVATNPRRPGSRSIVPYGGFPLRTPVFAPTNFAVCAFAIRATAAAWWVSLCREGNVQVKLQLSGSALSVYSGEYVLLGSMNVSGIIFGAEWYQFTLGALIHDTAGTVQVLLNGIPLPQLTLTGVDTKPSSAGGVDQVSFTIVAGQLTDVYVDTEHFHGDCIVETLYAIGAGAHADFVPSTGANYQNIDDAGDIDGDASYNMSSSQGDKDSFVAGNLVSRPTSVIKAVAIHMTARKDEAGSRELKPMLRIGGADYVHEDTGFILSDVYHGAQRIWEENPATEAPWTESGVNGAEIGYDLATAS